MTRAANDRALLILDVGAKLLVVAILVFAVTHPDIARFSDKGMPARLVLYPVLMLIVPSVWFVLARRAAPAEPPAYPYVADLLITLPFVIDMVGNALGLYESIDAYDDICHFLKIGRAS